MGCYDMIFLDMECPDCKRKSHMEFQTKDMGNMFHAFHKGDKVPKKFEYLEYLDTIGCCHSPECQEKSDKSWIVIQGSPSGFGLCFDAKIELHNGVITGKVFDIKVDEEIDKFIEEYRDKWEEIYKPRRNGDLVLGQFKEIK